ncbi:DnaD domain protein [Streptococcus pneumoniae]|uniref:DnaD domain protein n=1 Tax=Streptococcus pneumoniae TaxID=1313 RepID=UPI0008DE9DEE|nr:DnaD domain protein [Streptococcus pneumoniae]OIB52530.1 DNA helicase [Streptococcus pneumoniae]
MKPIDRFSYLKNNRVSQDTSSLVQCYLPIIGQEALSLYLYTISFWDNGRKEYLFSSILNHLNFGMDRLIKSLKILSAFNLLTLYQKGDVYQLVLHAPLSSQDFLEHPVYRRLLEKKIGDVAVEDLKVESADGEEIPVSLNQVFPELAELGSQEDLGLKKKVANDFDLDHFRQLMARDGLRFADEQSDVLNLFAIAEEKKWTWAQKPVSSDFSLKETTIIKEAKSKTALQFLAEIKQTRKGTITQTERELLQQMAGLGLLDEVINIILLLTFNKVDSANINEKYAMKVANDYAYQKIHSAEKAVLRIREREQKAKTQKQNQTAPAKTNIPKWSNPEYKNTSSAEELEEMERQTLELLAKLDNGGD